MHSETTFETRGLERVERFRWETAARKTLEVYRSAVLRPSAHSLDQRRRLRVAILNWADSVNQQTVPAKSASYHAVVGTEPLGIRTAWKALNSALHRRLRREIRRLNARPRIRSA